MLQTIVGILQSIILTIFIIRSPASSSSITSSSATAVPPTPTAPALPYCQDNSQTPYICGENCLISIPESDTIAFFESFNFPFFLTDDEIHVFCNLNFVLNSTQSRSVSASRVPWEQNFWIFHVPERSWKMLHFKYIFLDTLTTAVRESCRKIEIPEFRAVPRGNRSGLGLPEFCQGIASSLKFVKKVTKFKFFNANFKTFNSSIIFRTWFSESGMPFPESLFSDSYIRDWINLAGNPPIFELLVASLPNLESLNNSFL